MQQIIKNKMVKKAHVAMSDDIVIVVDVVVVDNFFIVNLIVVVVVVVIVIVVDISGRRIFPDSRIVHRIFESTSGIWREIYLVLEQTGSRKPDNRISSS